ncbi:MAG: FAD-dependent oxidoreductase, partial [Elainellaceae cyanobacterium]
IGVWGTRAHSVVLAQALQRLGLSVVLASPASRLLPGFSPSIAELLQAQLEAEGIRVVTAATLKPSPNVPNSSTSSPSTAMVQSDALTITVDGIIAAEAHCSGLLNLNLPPQVKAIADGIPVNARLQTVHPRIYACGYAINAYSIPTVAIAEAEVAVDNALSIPYRRVSYRTLPRLVPTDPPIARVGLTEQQARQIHGDITVLKQPITPSRQAQLDQTTLGLCQLILSKRGTILGAEAIGPNVQDWFSPLTWALAHRVTLQSLPQTRSYPAYGEVIAQLREQWRHQSQHNWRRNSLELLFNWRRDWTR